MKNFVICLVVLLNFFFAGNLLAATAEDDNDTKISNIIKQAYINENKLFYFSSIILKRFTPKQEIITVVNRHKKNMTFLRNIMSQYNMKLPNVSLDVSAPPLDILSGCKSGFLQEQELASFYSNSIITLKSMDINETIGMLIEAFSTLRDNSINENFFLFKSCSGN